MNNIRAFINGQTFTFDSGKIFSGGEVHVNVKDFPSTVYDGFVTARVQSSDDLMQLVLFLDAIYRKSKKMLPVFIPYFPYARQDRVCAEGDPLSLDAVSKILAQYTHRIYTYDLHSRVGNYVIRANGIEIINFSQVDIFKRSETLQKLFNNEHLLLVSPDKGATEKTRYLAKTFIMNDDHIVFGEKERDPTNGQLSGFSYHTSYGSLEGKDLLIVDDICDGGGTFIGLANELQKENPNSISLYVTHGIFSAGINALKSVFSEIYTTDSFIPKDLKIWHDVSVIKIV